MFIKGRRLRNFLIFPKFQMTLVFLNLFVITVNFILIFFQVRSSFNEISKMAEQLRIPQYSSFYNIINYHQEAIWHKLILAAIIIYIFCFTFTIIVSHRVSGPIHNLKNYFIRLRNQGPDVVGDLKFRDGDYYSELPEIINAAIDRCKNS